MCVLTHFFQSVPLALEFRPVILGGGVVVDESRWLGTLILVIITSERHPLSHGLYADTASLACPAHLGRDPCSVNTGYEPESSVTTAPWRTRRPLYFWNLLSKWHKSKSVGKWNVLHPFRASSITSAFFLINHWFLLCWIILLLLIVFVNCGLRTRGLHCLGHKNRFVHWIFVTRRIFMIFVLGLCSALSCQFVSLAKTCENSFVFLLVIFAKDLSCHCSSRIFPCGCPQAPPGWIPWGFSRCARHCSVYNPTSVAQLPRFYRIPCLPDRWNKFFSACVHCRALALLLPIVVFLFAGISLPFLTNFLAT